MPLRIIIADDHPIVRSGIRELLDSSGDFGPFIEVGSSDALVEAMEQRPFDVVLTDFNMPGGQITDGLNLLALVRQRWPQTPVMVLTMVRNVGLLRAVLDTGVRGLLNKSDALEELEQAVRAVSKGQTYISADLRLMINAAQAAASGSGEIRLSRRESEVMRMFASGLTVSQIALQLNRSAKTISRQKMDAMAKLGLRSDREIYNYAREKGLLV
ncbi:response regulator transcription factor [Lysobacter sp. S4-A87]|uniref:response regulator transcription factor n=1 Tax=Lysobacter sp. S4-A87 TaxID=2925843 RepID=UPI001F52F017|nr:response regulator transcription factor [Lysobacter sp. S4-A87]UNK47907.1 response regulator transcription factor [Lysobacter sp. S4-A87]